VKCFRKSGSRLAALEIHFDGSAVYRPESATSHQRRQHGPVEWVASELVYLELSEDVPQVLAGHLWVRRLPVITSRCAGGRDLAWPDRLRLAIDQDRSVVLRAQAEYCQIVGSRHDSNRLRVSDYRPCNHLDSSRPPFASLTRKPDTARNFHRATWLCHVHSCIGGPHGKGRICGVIVHNRPEPDRNT
jgi:hypothetical protein